MSPKSRSATVPSYPFPPPLFLPLLGVAHSPFPRNGGFPFPFAPPLFVPGLPLFGFPKGEVGGGGGRPRGYGQLK